MNKIHRTVWNEARQCYVVASEAAKARGKASSSCLAAVPAVAAALMALGVLGSSDALAVACPVVAVNTFTVVSGVTVTTSCPLSTGQNFVIDNGGGFSVGSNYALRVNFGSVAGNISNSGFISGSDYRGIAVQAGSSVIDIINLSTGSITNQVGIRIDTGSHVTGSFSNAGTINGTRSGIGLSGGTVNGGIANSGSVVGGSSTGIRIVGAGGFGALLGGLTNTGIISTSNQNAIYVDATSTISKTGGIAILSQGTASGIVGDIGNDGRIVGDTGLSIAGGTVTGGIVNSGTISGVNRAISVDPSSSIGGITIAGSNTAKFIGPVVAAGKSMNVANGATYTGDNGNQFTVSGFTTAGTLGVAAGGTATVTGNYTQNSTGTFRVNATSASSPGNLTVTGTAALPSSAKFELVTSPSTNCGDITAGGTIAGVLKSGSMTSSTFAAVTDDCTNLSFTAQYNSGTSAIDLVAATPFVNTAPTFVGATTSFTIAQGAAATDMKGYLVASDTDASQTLTWTQNSAPNQSGTLSISGATASSGSATITASGTISYTPVATFVGTESFVVQVSDATGSALRTLTGTIGLARTVTVNPLLTLNAMTAGTPFVSQTFTGAGGYGAYTCDISSGALPTGLTLSSGCVLSGTPTTAASYNFTVRVRDSSTGLGPFAGTQAFSSVTVAPANTAPTFVGATTTLTVAHGAAATDIKALMHASV